MYIIFCKNHLHASFVKSSTNFLTSANYVYILFWLLKEHLKQYFDFHWAGDDKQKFSAKHIWLYFGFLRTYTFYQKNVRVFFFLVYNALNYNKLYFKNRHTTHGITFMYHYFIVKWLWKNQKNEDLNFLFLKINMHYFQWQRGWFRVWKKRTCSIKIWKKSCLEFLKSQHFL